MFAEHLVLHSLGLCVAFLLALPVLLLARKDPVVGHRLLLILLAAGLVLPAFTLPLAGKAASTGDRVLARWATEPAQAPIDVPVAPPTDVRDPSIGSAVTPKLGRAARDVASSDATERSAKNATPAGESRSASPNPGAAPRIALSAERERERLETTTPPIVRVAGPTMKQRARDAVVGLNSALRRATPYVIVVWLLGVLLVGRRHLLRLIRTARLVKDATPVTDAATLEQWRLAHGGHALAGRIRLRRSEAVDAPACWGVTSPVILLPSAERAAADGLVFALRHELVHLERRDPLAALAQAALKTVYWFHPVAWWLSAQIDRTRELACDQLVAANASQRKRYALALLDHARAALPAVAGAPAVPRSPTLLHWAPTLPQLRRRIDMLLNKNTPLTMRRRLVVLGGAATAVLLLLIGQGTVAATMLSDAPLSERIVAFCPPKTTPSLDTRPIDTAPAAPKPARKAHKAKRPQSGPAAPNSVGPSVTVGPSDPFQRYTGSVLPANDEVFFGTPRADTTDPLRDALIEVLTETSDQDARVTAARALGTQLHDPAVRRAFARVLRDEWEGSEVREAVGDALLQSSQFTPEAQEIIAALLKRDGDAPDLAPPVDTMELEAGIDSIEIDTAELDELRAHLGEEFADVIMLDEDMLEDLQELEAEVGDLDSLSIEIGDAIETLECDDSGDEPCEEEGEDACDSEGEDEEADDRREAIVDLLRDVREHQSPESTRRLMDTLLAKRASGDNQVRVVELLRVLFAPQPAPNPGLPMIVDTVSAGEDT